MPQTAAADENGPIGSSGLNYSYTTADKTLTISGAGTMPDFTNDQPWKNHQGEIETVVIGDGVSSVGANAFADCRKLTSVTLPVSVTAIGGGAFLDCKALTDITVSWDASHIPNINPSAFGNLTLEEIILHVPAGMTAAYRANTWDVWKHLFIMEQATIGDNFTTGVHWEYNDNTRTLSFTGAGAIPDFIGADDRPYMGIRKKLQAVTIGAGVTTMGESAFSSCTALTNVTLSDKLTTIEERAFNGCSQLKNVTIPNSVTSIGNGAFAQCTALKNVNVFWDTPLTIPADAFSGIDELNKVKLYVPAGKKGAYQAANVWKGFDVQEIPGAPSAPACTGSTSPAPRPSPSPERATCRTLTSP